MLLVPKIYAEIALGLDFVILITSLLFRKPKRRTATSSSDHRRIKLVGYYIIGSAIVALVVVHYASFPSYLDYFAGLLIDALIFYTGLRVVTQNG